MLKLVKAYKAIPLAPRCRFHPSCSEYAQMKLQQDGASLKTFAKIIKRILKCNPFSKRRVYLE